MNRARVLVLLSAIVILQCFAVRAENLPAQLFGVEFGKTYAEQAVNILHKQGWSVKQKDNANLPDCRYLFIYGKEKPLELWGQNWTSAMYVAENASSQPIREVYISTSIMKYAEAKAIFDNLAASLHQQYKQYCKENTSETISYRQRDQYLKLAIHPTRNNTGWYVFILIGRMNASEITEKSIINDHS